MKKNITKNELIEMVQVKEEEIENLKGEIERLAKYEKYDEMSDELYAIYESLKRSGFNDDMASEIFKSMLSVVAANACANSQSSYMDMMVKGAAKKWNLI